MSLLLALVGTGGGPGAQVLVQTARLDGTPTFFTHTLSVGPVTLTQTATYSDPDSFFTHALSAAITLAQSATYSDPDSFFTHTLTPGAVTLTQSATYTDPDTFFTHTLTQSGGGGQTLTQDTTFSDGDSFFTHTLTPGPVALTQASTFADGDTFFAHTLTPGAVSLTQAARYDDPDTFFAHTLSVGVRALTQTARYDDPDAFFTHVLSQVSNQTLTQTARFDNQQTFFTHQAQVQSSLGGRGRTRRRKVNILAQAAYVVAPTRETSRPEPGGSPPPVAPVGVMAAVQGNVFLGVKAPVPGASLLAPLNGAQLRQSARENQDNIRIDLAEVRALKEALQAYAKAREIDEDDEEILLLAA